MQNQNPISIEELQNLCKQNFIEDEIININILQLAFIHSSYKIPLLKHFEKNNERLEFIGDGILECIIKLYLYERFPNMNEGFMTEKKISLVKNERIGQWAINLGLSKYYLLSKEEEESGHRKNTYKLGCLFESFLAAIYINFGFNKTKKWVEILLEKYVDWIQLIKEDDNYKNQLQKYMQQDLKQYPKYLILSSNKLQTQVAVFYTLSSTITIDSKDIHWNSTPPFISTLYELLSWIDIHPFQSICLGIGIHKNKKKAEQLACQNAIKTFWNFKSV